MNIYTHSQRFHEQLQSRDVPSHRLKLMTSHGIFRRVGGDYDFSKVDSVAVEKAAILYKGKGPVVHNLEKYDFDKDGWKWTTEQFETIVDIWRRLRPEIRQGFYAFLPKRDYWTPVNLAITDEKLPRYEAMREEWLDWRAHNAKHRRNQTGGNWRHGLADRLDFVAPSLYTFYPRQKEWELFAEANLREGARYGKPQLAWLWAGWANNDSKLGVTKGEYIGDDFVRRQLDFCSGWGIEGVILFEWDQGPTIPDSYFDVVAEFAEKT